MEQAANFTHWLAWVAHHGTPPTAPAPGARQKMTRSKLRVLVVPVITRFLEKISCQPQAATIAPNTEQMPSFHHIRVIWITIGHFQRTSEEKEERTSKERQLGKIQRQAQTNEAGNLTLFIFHSGSLPTTLAEASLQLSNQYMPSTANSFSLQNGLIALNDNLLWHSLLYVVQNSKD